MGRYIYETFDFNFIKIKEYIGKMGNPADISDYLLWVIKKYDELDDEAKSNIESDFEIKLKKEFEYYKERFEIWKEKPENKIIIHKKKETAEDILGSERFKGNQFRPIDERPFVPKFTIMEIEEYLRHFTEKKKLEYVEYLQNEFHKVSEHYTYDDLKIYLEKYGMGDKYINENNIKRTRFGHLAIKGPYYIDFKKQIENTLLPYLQIERYNLIERIKSTENIKSEKNNVPQEVFQHFGFNWAGINGFCDRLLNITDKLRYISWVKTEFELYFLDRRFVLEYEPGYKITKEKIDSLYEHLIIEERNKRYNLSNQLIDEDVTTHPRFDYDIDKIITYSNLFKDSTKKEKYIKDIFKELEGLAKKIELKTFVKSIKNRGLSITVKEINQIARQEYNEYVKSMEEAIQKIMILKKNKVHIFDNTNENTREKKTAVIGKYIWLDEPEKLKILIKLLQTNDFIENLLDKDPESGGYLANFIDKDYKPIINTKPKKIKHIGPDTEVSMIIGELMRKKYIDKKDIWENTLRIFVFKKGKSANALSNAYTTGNPKRWEMFKNNILSKLKT